MAELHAVRDMWEEEVGRVSRVNLPDPDVVRAEYDPAEDHYCGIYFRYYDRDAKEHKFCLSLIKAKDLHVTRDRPTSHLATLQMARAALGDPKISYCIGFFVEGNVLKRNSCSNEKYYGDRSLPERIYTQLVDIVKMHFSSTVRRDDAKLNRNDDNEQAKAPAAPAPAAADRKKLVLAEDRRWPARTQKGGDCSRCLDKGKGVFCHLHVGPSPDPTTASGGAGAGGATGAPAANGGKKKKKNTGEVRKQPALPSTPPRKAAPVAPPPTPPPRVGARRWPALTKKKKDCKDCTAKGKGNFCYRHESSD